MSKTSALLTSAVVLVVFQACATAREASRVAYYSVEGGSAKEVYESIRQSSPKVAPNAIFAFTAIATKTEKHTKTAGGKCGYRSFKTSAYYVFYLPRHSEPVKLPPAILAKWRDFGAYLQHHEEGHRALWRQCFASYDNEAVKLLASNCDELERRREKAFNRIKRGCVRQDEAYDFAFRKEVRLQPFVIEALQGK